MSKIISSLLFILCLALGCKHKTEYNNKLFEQLFRVDGFHITDQTKAVVLISDNNCSTCNQIFATFASRKITNDNILFVISAEGNKIDIAPYLNSKRKNVLFDTRQDLYYSDDLQATTIFLLNDKGIDSVLEINSASVEQQIEYLNNVL